MPGRDFVAQWGIALLTVALVAAPLVPIVYQSFSDRPLYDGAGNLSLDNYIKLFGSAQFMRVLWNTFALGALTTILGTLIGVAAAIVIGRTNMPGRALIGEVLIWPLYISHRCWASASASCTGRPAMSRCRWPRCWATVPGISTRSPAWR